MESIVYEGFYGEGPKVRLHTRLRVQPNLKSRTLLKPHPCILGLHGMHYNHMLPSPHCSRSGAFAGQTSQPSGPGTGSATRCGVQAPGPGQHQTGNFSPIKLMPPARQNPPCSPGMLPWSLLLSSSSLLAGSLPESIASAGGPPSLLLPLPVLLSTTISGMLSDSDCS